MKIMAVVMKWKQQKEDSETQCVYEQINMTVALAGNNQMCDTRVFKVLHKNNEEKICANEIHTGANACAGESQIRIPFHSLAEVPWTVAK
jgi:hypothetical protein